MIDTYVGKLKSAGYKLTPRRKTIIELFRKCGSHLTAEDTWKKLSRKFDRCGLPGVYRNLESLVECGILTRVERSDRKKHYGLCTAKDKHHHHHITCIECGKVEEIKECAIAGRKKINGFKVVSHFVQVDGICKGCS